MTLSSLQGESQVNVFHLLVEIGLLPFYKYGFPKLHLVLSCCRVQDLEAIRCVLCKIARALNSKAISKYVTLKMTDVPSRHVWKIKESCYVLNIKKKIRVFNRIKYFTQIHVFAHMAYLRVTATQISKIFCPQ